MKRLLLCSLAVLSLVACAPKAPSPPAKPELGSFGVATEFIKTEVAPGDDFFRYVNGKWLDTTEIPADRTNYGAFAVLREQSEARVRAIIEDSAKANPAAGSLEDKVGTFYASYMDEAAIEAKGLAAAQPALDRINALKTKTELAKLMGEAGFPSVFGSGINLDSKNTERYLLNIGQDGLSLPDRDYYLDARFKDKREAYKAFIASFLELAKVPDAKAKAARIYAFEEAIARVHWTQEQSRDAILTYNLVQVADLNKTAPGFDWAAFLEGLGAQKAVDVNLYEKGAIVGIGRVVKATPLSTLQDWMTFQYLTGNAQYLSKALDDATFEFFNKTLRGQEKQRDRWKRGVALIDGTMGEAVGAIYVSKHFSPESKTAVNDLVNNLRVAMKARLEKLDWMAPETKAQAFAKLDAFAQKIGYPDKWRDYTALNIVKGDLMGNVMRAQQFEQAYEMGKLGKPVDRGEWLMSPQTVNAYYWPEMNEIVFPAAILQPPFFDVNADPAVNYGGIGAVIGHEISHGFDDQGRLYNGKGLLQTWWTPDDDKRFMAKAKVLVDQYNAFEPLKGFKVNGGLTLGENIADFAGVTVAYDAYKLSLGDKPAPVVDGFTGDQRFFLGFGQIWQSKIRDEALKERLASDPHSPAEYRVNGVLANFEPWYQAFGVTAANKMYLPPEKRAQIW